MIERIENRKDESIEVGKNDLPGLSNWFYHNYGVKITSNGKFHCNGNVVYSYETAIGKLHENKDYDLIMLITTVRYSTTTSKHVSTLLGLCEYRVAQVPNIDPKTESDHIMNMSALVQTAINEAILGKRADFESVRQKCYEQVRIQLRAVMDYAQVFHCTDHDIYNKAVAGKSDVKAFIEEVTNG